jgi:hypothetical protein
MRPISLRAIATIARFFPQRAASRSKANLNAGSARTASQAASTSSARILAAPWRLICPRRLDFHTAVFGGCASPIEIPPHL